MDDIGARRLRTVVGRVVDEISFSAHHMRGQTVTVNAQYCEEKLGQFLKHRDLSKFVL